MDFSAGSLVMMLLVSTIGFSVFLYGKKQTRPPQLVTGAMLMGFPYLVTDALWMAIVATTLIAGLWFAVRRGL